MFAKSASGQTRLLQRLVDTRVLLSKYRVTNEAIYPEVPNYSQPQTASKIQWRTVGSVCVARFPRLTRPKSELHLQFEAIQNQLRFEKSRMSDYELEEIKIKEIIEEIERKAKLDELVDDQMASAPDNFQEMMAQRKQALKEFVPAPRVTQADKDNDIRSLNRKLDQMLYLIVKKQQPKHAHNWQMPQGGHEEGESLLETAKRELAEECGSGLKTLFLSRSPCAFMSYQYIEPGCSVGAKVFFFKAQWTGGEVQISDELDDYAWVTKDEMKQFVTPDFYKAVSPILLE